MKNLELQLSTKKIALNFDETLHELEQKIGDLRHTVDPDPEVNSTYIELIESGVDLTLKGGRLSSVYLFLDAVAPRNDTFEGRCNFLSQEFFAQPTEEKFLSEMEAQGFSKHSKKYPNAIDYLDADIRVRLRTRLGRSLILIDDGSMIR